MAIYSTWSCHSLLSCFNLLPPVPASSFHLICIQSLPLLKWAYLAAYRQGNHSWRIAFESRMKCSWFALSQDPFFLIEVTGSLAELEKLSWLCILSPSKPPDNYWLQAVLGWWSWHELKLKGNHSQPSAIVFSSVSPREVWRRTCI